MNITEILERQDQQAEADAGYVLTLQYDSQCNPRAGFPEGIKFQINGGAWEIFGLTEDEDHKRQSFDISPQIKTGNNTIQIIVDVYELKTFLGDWKSTARLTLSGPRGIVLAEIYDSRTSRRRTEETLSWHVPG